ncbi:MAG TPA: hypothetical protein VMF52_19810 [Steroidobacteraceae bacterium]|nr:hypothetical protein [Steroidobacteraceae bacterium]
MAATLVFPATNNFNQGDKVGICTFSSLTWARRSLELGRGLTAYSELGMDNHSMNLIMATVRKLDNDPVAQSALAKLVPVTGGDENISSYREVIRKTKATSPYVAIFWTREHTMAYRYHHHEKEFFDIETGLWRAKYSKDIEAKMKEIVDPYGAVIGMRLVKLAA